MMKTDKTSMFLQQKDTLLLTVVIILLNLPLLFGYINEGGIFRADRVCQGQWYRCVTAPFIHVSFYHLMLDGLAFILLYSSLPYVSVRRRLWNLAGIHAAVMAAVVLFADSAQAGYCGLSGIAHGLTVLWCLEMMRHPNPGIRWAGWVGGGVIGIKCVIEAIGGQAMFAACHLGDVGTPVICAHWGGALGAVAVFGLMNLAVWVQKRNKPSRSLLLRV